MTIRKVLLVTILFFIGANLNAQVIAPVYKIEDLVKYTKDDTAKLNFMIRLATAHISVNSKTLDSLADLLINLSTKHNHQLGLAYGMSIKARARIVAGDMQAAEVSLQKADSLSRLVNDNNLKVWNFIRLHTLYNGRETKITREMQHEADSIVGLVKDPHLRLRYLQMLNDGYNSKGDLVGVFETSMKGMKMADEYYCFACHANLANAVGVLYSLSGNYEKSTEYLQLAISTLEKAGAPSGEGSFNAIGENYRLSGQFDKALEYYRKCVSMAKNPYFLETAESNMADVYEKMDSLDLATQYAFSSLKLCKEIDDLAGVAWIHYILSRVHLKRNNSDSSLYYAKTGMDAAKRSESLEFMRDNAKALADVYAYKKDFQNAYIFNKEYVLYRDSMISAAFRNKSAVLEHNMQMEKKEGEISALNQQKKAQKNFLISISSVLLLILITAIALLRNNRLKQKAKNKIEKAYGALKATQAQLVQSEKMASLGELTAGIAHEIQNPLNFVNNFSEVNAELIKELKRELKDGNMEEANSIANDIESNSERISHHGKRADSIVKGMLQHSRTGSDKKELTEINILADEYLRLAYHGLRAKDKSFNAEFKANLDKNVGKISVLPQEIGRVLLNLINNAFYAVSEKQKKAVPGYEALVSITTKKVNDHVEIRVADNGEGIPARVMDKIFQPFFTTKPAGQGTGLGLSLSYDIITKGHGGSLTVDTKEGEGSTFIIQLPAA